MSDLISRQAAIDKFKPWLKVKGYSEGELNMLRAVINELENLPPVQQANEMLERCKFEYIHACKIVSIPTPDVTERDKQDAYAVIKALQPIFGDVAF